MPQMYSRNREEMSNISKKMLTFYRNAWKTFLCIVCNIIIFSKVLLGKTYSISFQSHKLKQEKSFDKNYVSSIRDCYVAVSNIRFMPKVCRKKGSPRKISQEIVVVFWWRQKSSKNFLLAQKRYYSNMVSPASERKTKLF